MPCPNSLALFNESNLQTLQGCSSVTQLINQIEHEVGSENVKYKPWEGQVVLTTSDYVYKIYLKQTATDLFTNKLRQVLAQIYREEYGLHWEIKEHELDGHILQIQEREVVQVCTDKSDAELIQALTTLIDKITIKMDNFKFITDELSNHHFKQYKLRLIRDCVLKNADYGITKDGKIILLDDADWTFVFCDMNNEIAYLKVPPTIVTYENTPYYLYKYRYKDDIKWLLSDTENLGYKFWLIEADQDHILKDTPIITDLQFNYLNQLTQQVIKNSSITEVGTIKTERITNGK